MQFEEPILRRIYLARQMLNEGVVHSQDPSPLARMRAVLALDHAIEMLLSTLLPLLGVSVDRNWSLPTMVGKFCERKPTIVPHKTPIERLRRLRNRVQHDGIVPSSEDALMAGTQAEGFFRDVLREATGYELEEITLASLIVDEKAREHVLKAEENLHTGDFGTAIIESGLAFEVGWYNFVQQYFRWRSWGYEVCDKILGALEKAFEEMHLKLHAFARGDLKEAFRELTKPIELSLFGISPQQYFRFQQLGPRFIWTLGSDEPRILVSPDWHPTKEEALLAFDFACTALLQLQEWLRQGEREAEEES